MKSASVEIGMTSKQTVEISIVKESIVKALAYFDIFQYPLTTGEIRQFLERRTGDIPLHEALTQLLKERRVFVSNGFYSVSDNPLLGIRRKEGNARADKLLKKAERIGRFLYRFPFARGIGVSGSLSKNYAAPVSDIDFFIITEANRLWISRTLMHLYKKFTFLTGKQHYYCMNYYIDEEALYFEEQNIFSAIEIKTLVPVAGNKTMEMFFETNNWTDQWFPALTHKKQNRKNPGTWFKQVFEWLLKGSAGTALDCYLQKLTQKRWKQKEEQGKTNLKGQPMGFISGKHFAMSNPGNFREKVLQLYKEKLDEHKLQGPAKHFPISIAR